MEKKPEELAEDKGICGKDAKWYYIGETLVIYGKGQVTEYTWYNTDRTITTLVVGDGITELGDDMFWMNIWSLHGGENLKNVYLADSITSIGSHTFGGCKKLEEIVLPESLKTIGRGAFSLCNSLSDIIIPDGVKEIGERAFFSCKNLLSISIPKTVENIGYGAFTSCDNLTDIRISEDNKKYELKGNSVINKETKTLISGINKNSTVPEGIEIIGEDAFDSCNISNIIIPDGVIEIGERAFYSCNIINITIPEGVVEIGECAFCSAKLSNVQLPDSLSAIGKGAFSGCVNLKSIIIPKNVNYIGGGVFFDCQALESLVVDSSNKKYDSRDSCNAVIETNINKLVIACPATTIPESVTSIEDDVFDGKSSILKETYEKALKINPKSLQLYGYIGE